MHAKKKPFKGHNSFPDYKPKSYKTAAVQILQQICYIKGFMSNNVMQPNPENVPCLLDSKPLNLLENIKLLVSL